MKMKDHLHEVYGLKPMTISEEIDAPKNIRAIRYSKMKVIDDCNAIIIQAENIIRRAQKISEIDEDERAEYLQEWLKLVHSTRIKMDSASEFGFNT